MLRRLLVALMIAIAGILSLAVIAFGIYDLREYQPRIAQIDSLIQRATPSERRPPAALMSLLEVAAAGNTSWSATRILLSKLRISRSSRGAGWHGRSFLWWLMVRLHLDESQQLAIVCSQEFLGNLTYGFEAGAQTWFGKPLAALTEEELATLVVLTRFPSRFSAPENRGILLEARDRLLQRKRAADTHRTGGPSRTSSGLNPSRKAPA